MLSTEPGQYTLDLAVIEVDAGKVDANNYRGNAINISNKYTRQDFMDKVYLDPTSPTSFKFPCNRLVTLRDQVPESALVRPPMLDADSESFLIVFKNGAKTGTTIAPATTLLVSIRSRVSGRSFPRTNTWARSPPKGTLVIASPTSSNTSGHPYRRFWCHRILRRDLSHAHHLRSRL